MLYHCDLWLSFIAISLFLLSQLFRIARYFVCLGKYSIDIRAVVAFHLLGSFLCYLGMPLLTYEIVMLSAFLLYRPQALFPAAFSLVLLRLMDVCVVLGGIYLFGGLSKNLAIILLGLIFLGLILLRLLPSMLLRLEIKTLHSDTPPYRHLCR